MGQSWKEAVSRPQQLTFPWSSNPLHKLGMHSPRPVTVLAGRTQEHLENWKLITLDKGILEAITGYKLGNPRQTHVPLSKTNARETELMNQEIQKLLDKGAIQQVSGGTAEGYYSRIFLVPKKEGQYRPVINLRPLNNWIRYYHFKMEGIHVVKDLLLKRDYLTRIDLKDAYLTIPVHHHFHKFLRFRWQDQDFEFTCLPFGLTSAPRVFTKVMRIVIAYLRDRGIRCVIYLDDLLLMNRNREVLKEQTLTALDILEALGFLGNYPKSQLTPAQEVEYLGFLINSVHKELKLPRSKLDRIEAEAGQVLAKEEASARQLAQLIGRMSAAILAIYPAPLHYRSLQALKHKALARSGYDGMIRLSQEAKEDLRWWTNNLSQWNGQMLSQSSPHCVIETDASMMGWGAFYQGEATGGCWSAEEQKLHINELELLAVFYALRSFLKKKRGITVLVRSDNIAAVSHINKLGGTRSPPLIAQTKQIFAWCLQRQIRVFAQHLPGKANLTADYLSRYLRDRTDWTLNANVFRVINQHWGPLEVDLFATRFSAQLDQFYSWRADPEAMATDAFTQHWGAIQAFAHPPWCLISRVLMKTQMEKTTVVLITPLWKAQPWFPVLLTMVIDYPILLPDVPDLLIPSPNCDCPVKDSHPCLVAWKVSGNTLLQNKFRQKLPDLSSHHGETRQTLTITLPGRNGKIGVGGNTFLPLLQMYQLS